MGLGQTVQMGVIDDESVADAVEFTINGKPHKVSDDVPADTTLNTYLREHAHLKGTKFMCLEGGCGSCIVTVHSTHPTTKQIAIRAINSCMTPVFSCHGWAITTVEGIGSQKVGYHAIQKRLAASSGTQCGYCSPGMVMNMYSLMEKNPRIKMKDVENSFGGNICRCTGYRPIMDAFKSLAGDAPRELVDKLVDIEELSFKESCTKSNKTCGSECSLSNYVDSPPSTRIRMVLKNGSQWLRPSSTKEVFEIFDMIGDSTYRFIAGNTGNGVYRIKQEPQVYIDLNGVPEIHSYVVSGDGLYLGANMNLTETMELFNRLAKEQPNGFTYCKTLADHLDLVANVPVRNAGTLAGNISLKHEYPEFPSDVCLLMEMVGTKLIIADCSGTESIISFPEYYATDMNKKLIVKLQLPALNSNVYITQSFKIMPRAQNAHAHVNAGFLMKVDNRNSYQIVEKPNIIFGGINPQFIHASKTEAYLNNKSLFDGETLKGALNELESELTPDHVPPDGGPEFRKGLALSLFYKFVLSVDPKKISSRNKSGGFLLERPLSTGKQEFDTDRKLWPLNQPVPKVEGLIQCSGEAEYTNDIPHVLGQVWGQLVLCDKGVATIGSIDASEALKIPGVVAFFTAKDIPGINGFYPTSRMDKQFDPVFAKDVTNYAGQAVGLIVAETHSLATRAAKKVKITYTKTGTPLLDVNEIINKGITSRLVEIGKIAPTAQKDKVKYKLSGRWAVKQQYHYTMEPISCLTIPCEDRFDVYPTTQWPTSVQEAINLALNIPENRINVTVKRLGGGYGFKVDRTNQVAVASTLAAQILNRPVRVVLNLETCMEAYGKRLPAHFRYDVGVSESGEIQYFNATVYQDSGYIPNRLLSSLLLEHIKNCYDASTWNMKNYNALTDTAWNTWCRAPGSVESISFVESVMEHIAKVVGKDPIQVRMVNMIKKDNPIPSMISDLMRKSQFDKRSKEIENYNKNNRWRKKGLSLVPMTYPMFYFGKYHATMAVYAGDGTVSITHGAIEMGQGLNTKIIQVAAHFLGVDMNLVNVVATKTITSPNDFATGASQGSESVSYAVTKCCEEINKRLAPVRAQMKRNAPWKDVVAKANLQGIDLSHTYTFIPTDAKVYSIHGVTATEVEVDVLTGQHLITRVDLVEDAGQSLSPEVDIGQVEGAFVMGLGYFTSEETVFHPETGAILTNRTWNYKPPGAKDIPVDFRVGLKKKAANPFGVLRSKATGEPPLCMSCSVVFAIRNALESARCDAGSNDMWFDINPPMTVERIWMDATNKKEMFIL